MELLANRAFQRANWRITVVMLLLLVFFGVVVYRLAELQIVEGQAYRETALLNRIRQVEIEAERGTIYDRNMQVLATSTRADSVALFPAEIRASRHDIGQIADNLAGILDMDPETVRERITQDSTFVWLQRKIPFEAGPQIRELGYRGVVLFEESQRYYPRGRLASQTIGFAGLDNQGLSGLEVAFDSLLAGEPGTIRIETDSLNREIPESVHSFVEPVPGASLVLTIDERLQYQVEKQAAELLLETGAERTIILVMDTKNGEILAVTGMPDFEPAHYGQSPPESWQNPAFQHLYEPGSTFKIVSAAALLEKGIVQLDSAHYSSGSTQVGGLRIRCWSSANPHYHQTFAEAFANSCNPVFAEAAQLLEKKHPGALFDLYRDLGFGSRTAVGFAGEARGMLPEDSRPIYVATSAIGQGIAMTPVQLAAATASLVGDGTRVHPVLVREVRAADGTVLQRNTGATTDRVVSEQTAEKIRAMMAQTILSGTGVRGAIAGYEVGGKTGTAQKPSESGGYHKDRFITSFVHVAPIDDPRLVVLVIADSPQGDGISGGRTTGPVSARVMEEALRLQGVRPDYGQVSTRVLPVAAESASASRIPDLLGLPLPEAVRRLSDRGIPYEVSGQGTLVVEQTPPGGGSLDAGAAVEIRLGGATGETGTPVRVPSLSGLRAFEAVSILESVGLVARIEGSGSVLRQEPSAGTMLDKDSVVVLICGRE